MSEESFKAMGFKRYIFKEYDGMDHTNSEQVRILCVELLFPCIYLQSYKKLQRYSCEGRKNSGVLFA